MTVLLLLHQAVLVVTTADSSCSVSNTSVMAVVQMVLNVHWLVHMQWMRRCDVALTVTHFILSTVAQRSHREHHKCKISTVTCVLS
jgi:hypothetical protein